MRWLNREQHQGYSQKGNTQKRKVSLGFEIGSMPNTYKKADKVTSVKIQDSLKKIVNTQLKTKRMIDDLTQTIMDLSERIDYTEKRLEILEKKSSRGKTKRRTRRTHGV